MAIIVGVDLGVTSVSLTLRNTDMEGMQNQVQRFVPIIFQEGAGTDGKSFAAQRMEYAAPRRLRRVHRYRLWRTLEVLIEAGCCPLAKDELDRWRTYDKARGLKRQYPIDAVKFEQWVRLDFDGDGNPDYSSPYQLRKELATVQLDFTQEINRFKLGRALYHIAQRRGFKSNKGETLKELEKAANESGADEGVQSEEISLKKSEEKKSGALVKYMQANGLPTVGCAFAMLEEEGVRIRASQYQAVRSQYKEEIEYIFKNQDGLNAESEFYKSICSEKKSGSIFYKNPPRSQGRVGKCTLEPTKSRCPISHPAFEKFRAFSFINNIRYRHSAGDEWQSLTAEQKLSLYREVFLGESQNFRFEKVRKKMEKLMGLSKDNHFSKKEKTINYDDRTSVPGSPISCGLKKLFGDAWESVNFLKMRKNKEGEDFQVSYAMEDIWHILFSYDDEERVKEFAASLSLDEKQVKIFSKLWLTLPKGYSMLSLKAIRNINRFLVPRAENPLYPGYIYAEAALLGKVPDILGEEGWQENEEKILKAVGECVKQYRRKNLVLKIANNLIAAYKALPRDEVFAYKNYGYQLDNSDKKDVEDRTKQAFGEKRWEKEPQAAKDELLAEVTDNYQRFFADHKRAYISLPPLGAAIKQCLSDNVPQLRCANASSAESGGACSGTACRNMSRLYHPSMIAYYEPAKVQEVEHKGTTSFKKLLGSPALGALKNPVVMRTLHQLRRIFNEWIKEGVIDEDTQIVVEVARDLNDANMRWAIAEYQKRREGENQIIGEAVKSLLKGGKGLPNNDADDIDDIGDGDVNIVKARLLLEQHPDYMFDRLRYEAFHKSEEKKNKMKKKYAKWLKDGAQCLYTGKNINIYNLFEANEVDIDHTIPRSKYFDNSMANKTVCDARYNREEKGTRIPADLGECYAEIKERLLPWEQKVEQLRENVYYWKLRAKRAQMKEAKDTAIRQQHLWQMELDYWQDKLSRFTMTEVPDSFVHRNLSDTRLITKYAYHYLKSVFRTVKVQKGAMTAVFREMLGIRKDRNRHSHHAVDAAVLSFIPGDAKRDELLRLHYQLKEERKLGKDVAETERKLKETMRACELDAEEAKKLVATIEKEVLVIHASKDQVFTPASRRMRKKGKIVWERDEEGKIRTDEKGRRMSRWEKGDCIRGELNQASFYGAIRQSKDKNTNQTQYGGEKPSYVIRKDVGKFASLAALHKEIVDENVYRIIEKQCEGTTFEKACAEGFYMLDKDGNKKNRIRHVRCYASDVKNPLVIKKQCYLSAKEHKQYYYVKSGDLYAMCRYRSEADRSKVIYEVLSLYEIGQNRKQGGEGIAHELDKDGEKYYLEAKIRPRLQVIVCKNEEELQGVAQWSRAQLSERLYVVYKVERGLKLTYEYADHPLPVVNKDESDLRLTLTRHVCARERQRGRAIKATDEILPDTIRSGIKSECFHYLLEGVDFHLSLDGDITFAPHQQNNMSGVGQTNVK